MEAGVPTPFFLVCPILRPFSFAWLPLPCLSALALAPPRPANFPTLQLSDFPTSQQVEKPESWQPHRPPRTCHHLILRTPPPPCLRLHHSAMNAQCSHSTLLSPPPAAPAALPGGKRRTPRPLCSNSRGAPCCIVPVHHTHTLTPRRAPSDPSRQLPNFPTSRKAGKPKSWQVGTHHYPPVG